MTVVDVASRFKAAEPLTSKDSSEVSKAFQTIYKRGRLEWPKVLQVDPGRQLMGDITREMAKHDVRIRRGNVNVHRDQSKRRWLTPRVQRPVGRKEKRLDFSKNVRYFCAAGELQGGQRRATDSIWSL